MFDCIHIDVNTPVANRYGELLLDNLFHKAVEDEHFSNLKGCYPNILRPLVEYLTPFAERTDAIDAQAQIRLKRLMANDLKDALLEGRLMRNGELMKEVLLPSSVKAIVNKKKRTVDYFYIDYRGRKGAIKLDGQQNIKVAAKPTLRKARK